MQLRSIAVKLVSSVAGVTLVSGFSSGPAQARPAPASAIHTSSIHTSSIHTSSIHTSSGRAGASHTSTGRASVVSARTGALAGLAARQAGQGVITGIVDGVAGSPLTGVCVIASGPSGNVRTITLAGGRYVLDALRPGGYTLHFSACAAGGGYVDQWSGGTSWPGHASVVTVAAGQVRQVGPVTLRHTLTALPAAPAGRGSGGSPPRASTAVPAISSAASATITASTGGIAGTVTGNGKPLTGVCVNVVGPSQGTVLTSKTGQYQIGGLLSGRYVVEFFAGQYCRKNTGNWLTQWYPGVTGPTPPNHPARVLVTAGKVTRGIDAAMRLGGEITGTTRSRSGKALAGVCVDIEGQLAHTGFGLGVTSGRNGSYAARSLFKGKYFVDFSPCGNKGNYAPQWYKDSANQAHAKAIEITGAEVVTHVDAALPPGGVISGVVKSKVTNAPVKGICAFARPKSGGPGGVFRVAQTSANGSYRITGLITGKYVVEFDRGCGNEGNYLPVQQVVSVQTSHTVNLNAALPPGAIVSGVVTDSHGSPVSGVCVQASNNHSFNAATTGADGSYSVDALPSGSYTVEFSGGCGNSSSYAAQFYQGQVNAGSANPVALTAGETTSGIDAEMQPGGTITGLVTGAGHPLNRTCVMVAGLSDLNFGFPVIFEDTKDGTYLASNLTPGLYAVDFGCFAGPRPFAAQWYKSRISAGTADLVSAAPGVITSDIGAALPRGGFISGMVTSSAHVKLSDVCVTATPSGGKISTVKFAPFTVTNHGAYRLGPLSPGSYDVQFAACTDRYATQWYHGSVTQQASTPVAVHFGATTSGIDAVMTGGGSISGLVTNGAHQPLPRICLTATDAAAQSTGYGQTNNAGHYTIPHLATGEYQVTFTGCLAGKQAVAGSVVRSVHVTAPHAVVGFNEKMAPAGMISGTVLGGAAATPQAGACVVAVPVSPSDAIGYAVTDDHGKYQVTNLAPGAYQMYFGDPFCSSAGTGYAPNTTGPVTLPAGGDIGGVDATLASDGAISGTVTQDPSTPVAGECVTAVPVSPTPDPLLGATLHDAVAQTTADGSYTLVGLLPGQYKVEFSTGCGDSGFQTQWWNDAASATAATAITVSASATVQHIDATLQP